MSVLPTLASIDNNTYCFHYDLVAYVRCIETSTFDNSTLLENRWLGKDCVTIIGSKYIIAREGILFNIVNSEC